jgi:hypothetical protein
MGSHEDYSLKSLFLGFSDYVNNAPWLLRSFPFELKRIGSCAIRMTFDVEFDREFHFRD